MRLPHTVRRLGAVALGVVLTGTLFAVPANADLAGPVTFGNPGDVPIIGDWNGDNDDEIGVYRPGNRTFYPYP